MRRNVIGTVLVTLLVIGALGALGYGLFQVGYQQGLVQNGAEVVVSTPGPGPYPGFHGWGWGWGFGFFGIFRILFLFLIIGLVARLIFGPRRWGWGPAPYRRGPWGEGPSTMEGHLTDWHRRAHDEDKPAEAGPDA